MNSSCRTSELIAEAAFVLGKGKALESLNATILEIARTDIPVLILGESGTGKEVYARLLHRLSDSSNAPLKKVNCAVLDPAQLLHQVQPDSHRKSKSLRGGSLYLDNVDELDLACQRALLSVLADSEDSQSSHHFARLISSSSRDLEADVKKGHFRKELYFRINGVCLQLPPLHERKEDIGALLEHFLQKHALELHKIVPEVTHEAIECLTAYDWPGNIRELENLARKMVALGSPDLALNDIRTKGTEPIQARNLEGGFSLKNAARAASRKRERELILEALERTKWNRKRAARELQISYKALLYKLKQIGSPEAGR